MGQAITLFNNLAKPERPIAVRRSNNFEGKQVLSSTDTCTTSSNVSPYLTGTDLYPTTVVTTTNTSPPLTQPKPPIKTDTTVSSVPVSTTLPDSALIEYSISTLSGPSLTNHSTSAAAFATLSSPAIILTSTPAPSQIGDYKIPFIAVGCIAGVFIPITAIIFIIRHLRKKQRIRDEVRSTIFGIRTPQPRPMIGGTPHEQLPSSSDKLDRSLPTPVSTGQHAQRDRPPSSILFPQGRQQIRMINSPVVSRRPVMEQLSRRGSRIAPVERSVETEQQRTTLHEQVQQSSGQVDHLQQLVHANGVQGQFVHEDPPAYV